MKQVGPKLLRNRLIALTVIKLLLCSSPLYCQQRKLLIDKADSLYTIGEYNESVKFYSDAFKIKDGNGVEYYNAACTWALLGKDSNKAFKYLTKAIDKGYKDYEWILKDMDLTSLHECVEWGQIVASIEKKIEERNAKIDYLLKNELENIYVFDQALRKLLGCAREKFEQEPEYLDAFWSTIRLQDSLNLTKIEEIIKKHGWPGISLVGEKANSAVWFVVQHAKLDLQEKYVGLLRESVLRGESSPTHLAMLEDRILMHNNKPQKYGSQIIHDKETGKYKLYELEDPENVNVRRAKVGLSNIEEYLEHYNIEFNY